MSLKVSVLSLFLLVLSNAFCAAQEKNKQAKMIESELYKEIFKQDSLMFVAFNEHNTEKIMTYFYDTLEFYHDKGGLADYKVTKENFIKLFASNKETGLRRDLVKNSMEVFPIKDYGAVETCLHRFCHKENGKDDCGVFKNIMVWKKTPTGWKVSRVISYDH